MFFHNYPYTDAHELNLDWIILMIKKMEADLKNFIGINTIKYADPILWNITSQYEANTVVIDPQTGNAYISTKAVPYGVHLNNTGFWTPIFNYDAQLNQLREGIATDEGNTTTATHAYSVGKLVWVGGDLYRVISAMIPGDSFVPGSNVIATTIDTELDNIKTTVGALSDLTTSDKDSIVNAINELVTNAGNLSQLATTDKDSLVDAINEIIVKIGSLTALHTPDTGTIVDSINSIVDNIIGDLSTLDSAFSDKSSVVGALNCRAPYVLASVTADGVKTHRELLDELYNQVQDFINDDMYWLDKRRLKIDTRWGCWDVNAIGTNVLEFYNVHNILDDMSTMTSFAVKLQNSGSSLFRVKTDFSQTPSVTTIENWSTSVAYSNSDFYRLMVI